MNNTEKQFLKESNAIEDVFDDVSLKQAYRAWEYLKKQKVMTLVRPVSNLCLSSGLGAW